LKIRHTIPALLFLSGSAVFSLPPQAAQSTLTISTEQELEADLRAVPCKEDSRLSSVKSLFLKMGATEDEITTDKFKSVENLVIRKQGQSGERIVIGAHYDKVTNGCGAIDKVNPKSVYLGYRFALLMIASISNESCDAFR